MPCGNAGGKTLKSKLARSGHTANLIGTRVVITGGILRDGSLYVDIAIVNLATLAVSRCVAVLLCFLEHVREHSAGVRPTHDFEDAIARDAVHVLSLTQAACDAQA